MLSGVLGDSGPTVLCFVKRTARAFTACVCRFAPRNVFSLERRQDKRHIKGRHSFYQSCRGPAGLLPPANLSVRIAGHGLTSLSISLHQRRGVHLRRPRSQRPPLSFVDVVQIPTLGRTEPKGEMKTYHLR